MTDEVQDSLTADLLLFLREEKLWWLAPLMGTMGLLSAVVVFAEGSAIAPFIYTIF